MKEALFMIALVGLWSSLSGMTPLPPGLSRLPVVTGYRRIAHGLRPGVTYHAPLTMMNGACRIMNVPSDGIVKPVECRVSESLMLLAD